MKSDPSTPHLLPQLNISQLTSSSAEAVVDERLAHRPDVYLLALTQFATRADTVEVVGRQCPSLFYLIHVFYFHPNNPRVLCI